VGLYFETTIPLVEPQAFDTLGSAAAETGRDVRSLTLDGRAVAANAIDLANDGQRREVRVATVECSRRGSEGLQQD
jgi:hypothetical protein